MWDGPEGAHWAEHADRYEAISVPYRQAMLEALSLTKQSLVLDIGCGTGVSTIEAGRIASAGAVLGVDLSSQMLERGRSRAADEGLSHVRFDQADAQTHPFDPATYDIAMSLFGAMFFADPVSAFTNIGRALRPGGSFTLLAWRDLERNEWVNAVRTALAAGRDLPIPPPGVCGPFSMADQGIAGERLEAAGYRDIDFSSVDRDIRFGRDADDAYSFVSTFGITRGLTADLDPATRTAALEQLGRVLKDHETANGVLLRGSAWLITATNTR